MAKQRMKPVFDECGRRVGTIAPIVSTYRDQLLAGCERGNIYQLPATTLEWGLGDRCPVCRNPIEPPGEDA